MSRLLHDMNPSVKFLAVIVSMLTMAFFFNPWTPLLFWVGLLVVQVLMSRVNWKVWGLMMLPMGLGAAGYLWTTLVFGADTGGEVIGSFLGIEVTDEQWARAWSLAFRVLAFSGLSLLFALTTDPVTFIMSLMQQLRVPPKLAYGTMVSYQFLPVLKDELVQIRQAQRLRGVDEGKHWWQRALGMRRLLIPMLAGAVRKAERAAFAMEAKGFTGEPRSEFYQPVKIGARDFALGGMFLVLLVGSCVAGVWLG
ncbi:energy-coupling factor transporter transmembrane component T family protein [Bhargavaea ullalensis]|uniref:Energy-coupling factor transport system permease protein n=1 Tax=Bhargavaea ullalensis TaxID=1265685 RepID=A0ABV2GEA9_9BACL